MMNLDRDAFYDKIKIEFSVVIRTKDGKEAPYDLNFPWGNEVTISDWVKMSDAIKKMIQIVDNSTQGGFDSFKQEVTKHGGIRLTRKVTEDTDEDESYQILPHDTEDYYATEQVTFYFTVVESRNFSNRIALENLIGLRLKNMEFMRIIAEAEKDVKFSIAFSFDYIVRPHFYFGDGVQLSIQGSGERYCDPKEYGPINKYKSMEICLQQGTIYKHADELIDVPEELKEELCNSGGAYVLGNVPVETIEYVFQALKEKYGFVRYHKEVDGTLNV